MPETHAMHAVIGPRMDQLPTPERRELGSVRRGPDNEIAIYDPGFPSRPWRIVYRGDRHRTGEWLADQDTVRWHDLVAMEEAARSFQAAANAALTEKLDETRRAWREERRSKGQLAAKLGDTRARLARAYERLRTLEAAATAAGRDSQSDPLSGHIVSTLPVVMPGDPGPATGRYATGCRQVDGTWLHGRPHTCPSWMHE